MFRFTFTGRVEQLVINSDNDISAADVSGVVTEVAAGEVSEDNHATVDDIGQVTNEPDPEQSHQVPEQGQQVPEQDHQLGHDEEEDGRMEWDGDGNEVEEATEVEENMELHDDVLVVGGDQSPTSWTRNQNCKLSTNCHRLHRKKKE